MGEAEKVFAFCKSGILISCQLFFSMNIHDTHDARHTAAFNTLGEMIQD